MLLALLIAQHDAPEPILPETNQTVWGTSTFLAIVILIVVVASVVTYVRRTRRIAERAAADAALAASKLDDRSGPAGTKGSG